MMKKFFTNSPNADQSVCGDNLRKAYLRPESEVVSAGYALMFTTSLDNRRDYAAGGDPFEQIDFEGDLYGRSDYGAGYDPFDHGDISGRNDYGFGGDPFSNE